jgi:hypothetical protein
MTLPAIFQRYTSATTRDTLDMEGATSLRDSIGRGVGGLKLIGIGLSLSPHLLLAMGGVLTFSSQSGLTKFLVLSPSDKQRL